MNTHSSDGVRLPKGVFNIFQGNLVTCYYHRNTCACVYMYSEYTMLYKYVKIEI